MPLLCFLAALLAVCPWRLASAGGIDTSTVIPESDWYNPDVDTVAVTNYIKNWQGKARKRVLCVLLILLFMCLSVLDC